MRRLKLKPQSGDTIIEVMLALTVLGTVIVGGYSIATRSLNGVRVSQERGEALKIAESQIEAVRNKISKTPVFATLWVDPINKEVFNPQWYGKAPGGYPPDRSDFGFCVSESGESVIIDKQENDIQDFSDYPAECERGIYRIYINTELVSVNTSDPSGAGGANANYHVRVLWEKAGGSGVETVSLHNRFLVTVGSP